jgi:N-acetylglucosamine-6-phosphate deacetylase
MGPIDIHFHGAFGIDLMRAQASELDELAMRLGKAGVAAFCPTTLSVPFPELREAVSRLGAWITCSARLPAPSAIPLGIHLEGPYIHPGACGAHPLEAIRPLDFDELELLWKDSQHHLKILTVAPERLSLPQIKKLVAWTEKRKIKLSLGHSKATEEQANQAFDLGFSGLTHAWNALPFHHREPGPLGAALGRPNVAVELILDQIHVAPTLMRWTRTLHSKGLLCYVSDCVPAAGTADGNWHPFGHLQIRLKNGACRLKDDHLAGGGVLLPVAFARWVELEAKKTQRPIIQTLREQLPFLTIHPLVYLGMKAKAPGLLKNRAVQWTVDPSGRLTVSPLF